MSELSDAIQAGATVAGCLGGAVAFIWLRVERSMARFRRQMAACQHGRAIKLTIIELLLTEVVALNPKSPVLARAQRLLDEVKLIDDRAELEIINA